MDNTDNLSVRQVVIIGAKPKAQMPDIPVPFVLTANAAVTIALEYRKKYNSKIIAVVSPSDLLVRPDMQEALTKSCPEEIVFLGEFIQDAPDYVKNHLNLKKTIVTVISFRDLYLLIKETIGWRIVFFIFHRIFSRGIRGVVATVIPDIFGPKTYAWMARSTGLNAIMYAIKRFPEVSEVIVAGIGLQPGGHFVGVGTFASKTAKADQVAIKCWPTHRKRKVFTTDDVMSDIGNVQKWNGKVFLPNSEE